MIFKGERPRVQEHGPYIYRERDAYSVPESWDQKVPIPGEDGKTANGIRMYFNQTAELNLSPDFKD